MWDKKFTSWIGSKKSLILHTIFFIVVFSLPFFGFNLDTVLLVLTTIVSLEAIYLAIFIQMTVNQNTESLEEVEEDLEEIHEEVEGIQEGVGEISSDIDEIQADVDEIQADVDEIQHDVEDIEKDKNTEKEKKEESIFNGDLESIKQTLNKLLDEVEKMKR